MADEVKKKLQEVVRLDSERAAGEWPDGAAASMRRSVAALLRAVDAAAPGPHRTPVIGDLDPQAAGLTTEARLRERLYELTDLFGGVATQMRVELAQLVQAPDVASRAAQVSDLNSRMQERIAELVKSVEEVRAASPECSPTRDRSPYDLSVVDIGEDVGAGGNVIEDLKVENMELKQEVDELGGELECALEELQQVRHDKEQFEKGVYDVHSALVDRLGRLHEEQVCLREAIADDARSGQAAKLQLKVTELESEVDQTRRKLEHVTRLSELHLDKALQQQISKIEVTLAQVQRRKEATESEARGAYRQARRLRLDTIYRDCFEGSGMALIWAAIQSVFTLEFAGADSPDASAKFQSAYESSIAPHVASPEALQARMQGASSLREMYHLECAKLQCKPNSGVLRLLPALPALAPSVGIPDQPLRSLDLTDNFLGDKGLQALLPLLQKMLQLEVLGLAHNGLQNKGVHALVEEVRSHPSLTEIDLSRNRISRSAGKELVSLVTANPRIRHICVDGTRIDDALKARISRRLQSASKTREP
eukprot:TRINITY_DN2670_c6_g1_i1.p1 TRINITY_DN2670_c6_g1~~TRINITY_DN2670_c6_g1_i1.p1  ORF type:complete len:557 (+),score=183.77 TRINITY_DN2670_c6_g1_i1:59-1672(+)